MENVKPEPGEVTAVLPRPRRRSLGFWPLAILLLVLAAALRFDALDSGLPHLRTRPDEDPVIQRTAGPARGEFDIDWTIYPSAYIYLCWIWGELGLRVGQAVGQLPPGDYLTTLHEAPERIFLIDRSLSALAGTTAVLLAMLLARRAFGDAAGLAAGLLVATCFLHARDSHAVKTDVLLSFWILVTLLALRPLACVATLRRGVVAGLAVGATMATKYPGILLLASVWAAGVMGSARRGWRRLVPTPVIAAGLVAGLFFLATSPFMLFNRESLDTILRLAAIVFPQALGGLMPASEEGSRGALTILPEAPGLRTLVYHARFSLWYGAGPAATLLAPLAVGWALWTAKPLARLAAITFLTWFTAASLSPHLYARYLTPVMPVLLLLEAGLLAVACRRFAGSRSGLALVLLTTLVAAQPLASTLAFNRLAARTDTRVLATRWMAENLPQGARMVVLGTRTWNWGVPELPPNVVWVNAKPELDEIVRRRVGYVLMHEHELFSSTVQLERREALLPRLRLLAEFDPYKKGRSDAVFEGSDAYYIPFHGFGAMERPGPRIRVYALE